MVKKSRFRKFIFVLSGILLVLVLVYFLFLQKRYPIRAITHSFSIGDSVDSYNGVVVYNNGIDYAESHGKHYSADSAYYYGKKWQCVEFIKRYYYDVYHHKMPNGFGHAKDFMDKQTKQGKLNRERGLLQFRNNDNEPPKPGDILIFGGKYGHVAIVTRVDDHEIEVVQQNIYMTPRETFPLSFHDGVYTVGKRRQPEGWLRMP